ncbi:helix-turn-helix domain-containing protein [Streptomyces kunmingensis]|uniref:Helix-turn-helix domain-containing protein n=1 Tax=Streptomyces kunmingensis TaxID=68225 RepID=A0ABU6CB28_9ACTN|nr:helix-turn-helix domain-containing protein [Streptomyces kunmingensis]MEB3961913.1 helix-turn-helix domain-containing protein [Streptomyces kunmingensis]
MQRQYYSLDQVADLLGLHVRTVRGYVRDGRLKATQVGRRYRVTRSDVDAFTGASATPRPAGGAHAEASVIVQVDGVDPAAAMRLGNTVVAVANSAGADPGAGRLRVESVYDEERAVLKIIVLGGIAEAAELLRIVDTLVEDS